MDYDFVHDEIKDIDQELNKLETTRDKILYLERMLHGYQESELIYGDAMSDGTAIKYMNNELKYLYRVIRFEGAKEALNLERIQWKGSPEVFGYVFTELVKNGFIELPTHAGNGSYSKLAKLCYQYFNVNNTTIKNLERVLNPKKNFLTEPKREKFQIPNISDLA